MNAIDHIVAEQVMGWKHRQTLITENGAIELYQDPIGKTHRNFSPTTNMTDARVVLYTTAKHRRLVPIIEKNDIGTQIYFKKHTGDETPRYGFKESAAIAICEAVLHAVGISFDTNDLPQTTPSKSEGTK